MRIRENIGGIWYEIRRADVGSFSSRIFYEKRMSQEVAVDTLGPEFKGYVLRITGGNDVRLASPLVPWFFR